MQIHSSFAPIRVIPGPCLFACFVVKSNFLWAVRFLNYAGLLATAPLIREILYPVQSVHKTSLSRKRYSFVA